MEVPCPLLTPVVEFQLSLIEKTRARMLAAVEGLADARLLAVPAGFRNNLLWNLGHVVAVQQNLCYEKSGLPVRVPVYFMDPFRKGTDPGQWQGVMDPGEVKSWLQETAGLLREDLRRNAFKSYAAFETGIGAVLTGVSEAVAFVAWHESQHLGMISSLRKLV